MDSRKVRRKLAAVMSVTMVMTSVLPSYAFAASSNDWDDQWIYDEDAWYYDEDDDEYEYDEDYRAWLRSVASDSEWATPSVATPSRATPSSALLAAVKSFNSEFEFVDVNGDVIDGDEKNIPETEDSFPYLSQGEGRTKGNIDLESYGYEEKEYFISGNANVYEVKNDKLATASNADYVNRILVFQPEDPADFSGVVYVEILNASSYVDLPDIWRRSYDYFMREGCVYIGVTSKEYNNYNGKMLPNGNVTSLKRFDKDRYDVLDWEDNGIIWDILGQVGASVKSEDSPLIYDGEFAGDISTYLIGQSQSGFYLNTFSNNFNHANYLMDEDELDELNTDEDLAAYEDKIHIFDGFLNVVGGIADAGINNDDAGKFLTNGPVKASEVPFILLVGQNDYFPSVIRDDADEEGVDMYRHYMVAGAPHSSKIFPPDMIDELQLRAGRPAGDYPEFKMDPDTGKPHTNTDLNMDVYVNAALKNLHLWATGEQEAPAGFGKGDIDPSNVDEFGNLMEGIVSPQLSVPVATYFGAANNSGYSDAGGSMIYLDDSVLEELYGDLDDYLAKYEAALDEAIEDRWILPEDKELMMEIAATEPVLGNPGRDDEEIEKSMSSSVKVQELNSAAGSVNGIGYSDTEYKVSGEANIYGLVRTNILYRRRSYASPYENYMRVCVPENFNNEIVLDLIFDGDGTKDVSEYMKAGKAYVAITADPAAAEAKGGNWDVLKYSDTPAKPSDLVAGNVGSQPEPGLVWDIISQAAYALKNDSLVSSAEGQALTVRLGADSGDGDYAYTYNLMFQGFEAYDVQPMNLTGSEKTVALNGSDTEIAGIARTSGLWSDVIKYKENENGPTIGATAKNIIEADGMYFKDSNGNGRLDAYEDWRNDAEDRAADLVQKMTVDDKIGMMFNNSRGLGINSKVTDSTGLLDETSTVSESIFGTEATYGTTETIRNLGLRHFILRQNPQPGEIAEWINQMNMVAEGTSLGIPVVVTSNSRNENGKMTFGMNDASGVFSTWPGTMGLAAAAKGSGSNDIFTSFAEIARSEWDASGLKKGYMYMVDTMTDPRWQRTYGTFGEDPELIADAAARLVVGFQGSSDGVQPDGVALTIKHFPGGGARENGFDPHYKQGQWNVYQTENSLQLYHLPGFKAAVENNVSSIMPYYAKPAALKSAAQYDENGKPISMQAVGFAFNKAFIKDLLRDQMGHKGYINSDSGIINNMAWGVEKLDVPERAAYAINAGTDIIGDTNDIWSLKEAFERSADGSKSDYYNGRTIPYGFTKEDVTVTEEALNTANERLLKEMFELGLFENPYRDPAEAESVVDNQANWDQAYEAHQQSVVLMKNDDHTLPLTEKKLAGKSVYVEYFDQNGGADGTAAMRENLKNTYGLNVTDDYAKADYAILFVDPSSGNYFSATQGYLELDICDGKIVHDVDEEGRPAATTHAETTLKNADRIKTISAAVKNNGGKVITNVNFTLAWMLGNVEPYSDALLAGFDTYADATMDVIMGTYNPTGRMPITLPRDDSVIAVNADGVCISPNDIPGYLKDNYMPDSMKDENGKAYAYRDANGSYYEMNFGLFYTEEDYNPGTPETPDTPDTPDTGHKSDRGGGSGSGGSYIRANAESGNWVLDEKGWWFKFNDGTWPAGKWMYLEWNGRNDWYYFHTDGYMATGWFQQDDGLTFYLHNVSDGTLGHMYTGWNQIDGKWYFFNTVSDGTRGRMLVNTTTPDGYQVGADGVWIQ